MEAPERRLATVRRWPWLIPSRETISAAATIWLLVMWGMVAMGYRVHPRDSALGFVLTLAMFIPGIAERLLGRRATGVVVALHAIWAAALIVAQLVAPEPWPVRVRGLIAPVIASAALWGFWTVFTIFMLLVTNADLFLDKNAPPPRYLRVPRLFHVGPGVILGILAFCALMNGLQRHDAASLKLSGALVAVLVLIVSWLATYRVEMTDTEITYRTIRGSRTLAWHEIGDAEVWRDRLGIQRLWLKPKPGALADPIQINLSVFEGVNARWLLQRMRPWLLLKPRYRYNRSDGPNVRPAD
jgi:hypothetical protein